MLPTPLTPGEFLYAPKCDQPGYSLHVLGSARVCVKLSHDWADFSTAESTCARDGSAYLFMTDTQEKIDLAKLLVPTYRVWVGMDDRQEEGVFRWADGRLVTEDEMGLFKAGQPDNYNSNEHCVATEKIIHLLNDIRCQYLMRFICEIPTE